MPTLDRPTLTIDQSAILANFRQLQAMAPGCAAVVKADLYGTSAYSVLADLGKAGCKTFFVATAEEAAIASTYAPMDADVFVLNSEPSLGFGTAIVNSLPQAQSADSIHALHLDTGMNRWGLSPSEIGEVDVSKLADNCLVMTHFVEAEVQDSAITAEQIKLFRELVQSLQGRLPCGKTIRTSLANSAGMFVSDATSDVPRPGYALYGGNPTPWTTNPMNHVVTLQAPLGQVRRLSAGKRVGYNGTWMASEDCWVATLGLGYADGWLRSSSGQGVVRFRDQIVPIVGRVSMDSIIINCGDTMPELDETITLIDGSPQLCVDAVAARAGTIGYEVLTSLGNRYDRRYV